MGLKMVSKASSLTVDDLKSTLIYDSNTGLFTYKECRGNRKKGSQAGTTIKSGYIQININRVTYLSHRLAWLYVYGKFPDNVINHKNGIRGDNRISNLEDVTYRVNSSNMYTNNSTIGVCYRPLINSTNPWEAYIYKGDKRIYLGYHKTEELGGIAYAEALEKINKGIL